MTGWAVLVKYKINRDMKFHEDIYKKEIKMKYLLLTALLLISQSASSAELLEWYKSAIKSPTPDELSYYIGLNPDCPVTEQEVSEHVEGVLIRSRIKPMEYAFEYNRLYLNITVDCLKLESNNPIYIVEAAFGKFNPKPAIIFDKSYGTYGIGPKKNIINAYKRVTEDAVTDYIKSNFNL